MHRALTSKLIHLLPTPTSATSHPPVPPVSFFSTTTLCPPHWRARQVPFSPYPGASLQLCWLEAPPCVCPQAGPPAGGWEWAAARGSRTCHYRHMTVMTPVRKELCAGEGWYRGVKVQPGKHLESVDLTLLLPRALGLGQESPGPSPSKPERPMISHSRGQRPKRDSHLRLLITWISYVEWGKPGYLLFLRD